MLVGFTLSLLAYCQMIVLASSESPKLAIVSVVLAVLSSAAIYALRWKNSTVRAMWLGLACGVILLSILFQKGIWLLLGGFGMGSVIGLSGLSLTIKTINSPGLPPNNEDIIK